MSVDILVMTDDPVYFTKLQRVIAQQKKLCHLELIHNDECGQARVSRLCAHGGFKKIIICYKRQAIFMPLIARFCCPNPRNIIGVGLCHPRYIENLTKLLGIKSHCCGTFGLWQALAPRKRKH